MALIVSPGGAPLPAAAEGRPSGPLRAEGTRGRSARPGACGSTSSSSSDSLLRTLSFCHARTFPVRRRRDRPSESSERVAIPSGAARRPGSRGGRPVPLPTRTARTCAGGVDPVVAPRVREGRRRQRAPLVAVLGRRLRRSRENGRVVGSAKRRSRLPCIVARVPSVTVTPPLKLATSSCPSGEKRKRPPPAVEDLEAGARRAPGQRGLPRVERDRARSISASRPSRNLPVKRGDARAARRQAGRGATST